MERRNRRRYERAERRSKRRYEYLKLMIRSGDIFSESDILSELSEEEADEYEEEIYVQREAEQAGSEQAALHYEEHYQL
ncbi:hypothetical protein DF186_19200 [Enterococcus hirae]|nr:hypothetical protein DF186_19200 [Enterococcus hirae]